MSPPQRASWKRRCLVTGIVLAWIGLTYNPQWGWWISGVVTAAILVLGRLAFGREWRKRFGLATGWRGAAVFAGSLVVLIPLMILVIEGLSKAAGLTFTARSILDNAAFLPFTLFQTLNEELVIGALLLLTLKRRFPNRTGIVAVATAALFALLHFAFYASPHHEWFYGSEPARLEPLTILTLFAVGLIRNNAILARGDIAISWALHLSFNIPFFVGNIRTADGSASVGEIGQFDAILGRPDVAILTALLAGASFLLYRRRRASPVGTGRSEM